MTTATSAPSEAPPLRLLGGSSEAATGSKAVGSCTRGCAPYRCTSILRRINKANREEGTRRGGRECEGGDQPKDIMQFSSVLLKAYASAADPFQEVRTRVDTDSGTYPDR